MWVRLFAFYSMSLTLMPPIDSQFSDKLFVTHVSRVYKYNRVVERAREKFFNQEAHFDVVFFFEPVTDG